MSNIKTWSDTLTQFLKSSNEDEKILSLFRKNILPKINNTVRGETLSWLEIGVGNGNKTQMIAHAIASLHQFKRIKLTICEPSINWLNDLKYSSFSEDLPTLVQLDFRNNSIEQFISLQKEMSFDFISLVQVMYSINIKNAILEYIDRRPKDKPCLLWIDVEDKSGDFYKIRKLLYQKAKDIIPSLLDELLYDLEIRNISYETFLTSDKICTINVKEVLTNENHWLFPFILGYNINDFNTMPSNNKNLVINIIRDYISGLGRNELNIPDISVLIHLDNE
ncbi:MAG: hypothetical protein JWN78_2007 [Bacteroidota bacterium]|nr:hypothetical protein [Bacteroidota bacterium]